MRSLQSWKLVWRKRARRTESKSRSPIEMSLEVEESGLIVKYEPIHVPLDHISSVTPSIMHSVHRPSGSVRPGAKRAFEGIDSGWNAIPCPPFPLTHSHTQMSRQYADGRV